MTTATAKVTTPLAARYLTQLCKHFDHKLPVILGNETAGPVTGSIQFSSGLCALSAADGVLSISVESEGALEQLQDVVARHLVRFAFREPLEVHWQ